MRLYVLFRRLQIVLKNLNINLDSNTANNIIQQKSGACLRVIQQIKATVDASNPSDLNKSSGIVFDLLRFFVVLQTALAQMHV